MFVRLALYFACLAVVFGRRHTEQVKLPGETDVADVVKEDVKEMEEKALEVIQKVNADAGNDDRLVPLSASLQVAPTVDDMSCVTSFKVVIEHVPTTEHAQTLGLVVAMTAKSEESATKFKEALEGLIRLASPQLVDMVQIEAPGRQVTITVKNMPLLPNAIGAIKQFSPHFGSVNVSVSVDFNMKDVLADLNDDTVLLEKIYKGIRYKVDATLTQAVEKALAAAVEPQAGEVSAHPSVAGFSAAAMAKQVFELFKGASASVKLVFDDEKRRELFESTPFLNIKYGQVVEMYKVYFSMIPLAMRGSPLALAGLKAFLAMESMETFDTVEVTGLPGLKVMAVYNTTEGEFQFLTKLGKDAGLPEILQNNSDRTFDIAALLNATGVPNATVADKWESKRLQTPGALPPAE